MRYNLVSAWTGRRTCLKDDWGNMLAEYLEKKNALLSALKSADEDLHRNLSMYAVLETDDPARPFEILGICEEGHEPEEARVMNERLFDRAFLDYGYQEVRSENNIEGTPYAPLEDLFADPDCIGCAPFDFFDEGLASARMAHTMDEEEAEEDPDLMRMQLFIQTVRGSVVDGQPAAKLTGAGLERVCGLLFKYASDAGEGASGSWSRCVVAFQRVQRSWVQQKSAFLLFDDDDATASAYSARSLKVGTAFDFVLHDGELFFRDLRALEMLFKYRKLAAQRAKDYADTFDGILADFEKLDERIDASRGIANKLLKLQKEGSPAAEMEPQELRAALSRLPYYNRKLKLNEEGKIMLTSNTEVSDFVKMLGDDFLVSPLTSARYESRSKRPLDSDEL